MRPHSAAPIFTYSDGDEIEDRLLLAIQSCRDISCASTELSAHIGDWPSEYHLSPVRHNLLRLFSFSAGDRILELGCGCGAITRYLGETGAEVVALEGSERRAGIARARCRDLPNVTVQCGNLMDYRTDRRFDYITLIGVLEYAPRYIHAEDPILACLRHVRSLLKEGGTLLVAIENQLGLKYFNGCDEDHLGKPYYGLHDLYRQDEPTTLGRIMLAGKLAAAGLPHQRFFYPFPDYKLPQIMLSEAALRVPDFDVATLLSRMTSRNAQGEFHPNFHENLAWRPIIENGLLPHLANAFLVVAGQQESATAFDPDFLAVTYTSDRLPHHATQTVFSKTVQGMVAVEKRRLFPERAAGLPLPALAGGELVHHAGMVCDYVPGELYVVDLQRRLARGEGIDAVIDWARDWLDLVTAALIEDEGSLLLPGHWVDAIPQNFIRTAAGKLISIDAEWSVSRPVPASWVILRGLMNALALCPTSPAMSSLSLLETIRRICASAGITLDDSAIRQACQLEAELRSLVYEETREGAERRLHLLLSGPPQTGLGALTRQESLEARCAALENEIRRVKSTASWQITKPLRLLANLPRLVKQRFKSS